MIIDIATDKVFIRHWNSNPSPLTQPDHTVSVGLVDRDRLQVVLQETIKTCNCAGGVRRNKYVLATLQDVSVWYTGHLNSLPETAKEIL